MFLHCGLRLFFPFFEKIYFFTHITDLPRFYPGESKKILNLTLTLTNGPQKQDSIYVSLIFNIVKNPRAQVHKNELLKVEPNPFFILK